MSVTGVDHVQMCAYRSASHSNVVCTGHPVPCIETSINTGDKHHTFKYTARLVSEIQLADKLVCIRRIGFWGFMV